MFPNISSTGPTVESSPGTVSDRGLAETSHADDTRTLVTRPGPAIETGTPHAVSHSLPVPGRGARASLRERLFTQQLGRQRRRQASQSSTSSGDGQTTTEVSFAGSPVAIAHSYAEYATSFGPYGELSRSAQTASSLPERQGVPQELPGRLTTPTHRDEYPPSRGIGTGERSTLSSRGPSPAAGDIGNESVSSSSVYSSTGVEQVNQRSPKEASIQPVDNVWISWEGGQRPPPALDGLAHSAIEEKETEASLALRLIAPAADPSLTSTTPLDERTEAPSGDSAENPTTSAIQRGLQLGKPRIVFMGRSQSGKTSFHSVVFHQTSAHETLFLESTPRIVAHDITYSPWIQCQVVDAPGIDSPFWEHFCQPVDGFMPEPSLDPSHRDSSGTFKQAGMKTSLGWTQRQEEPTSEAVEIPNAPAVVQEAADATPHLPDVVDDANEFSSATRLDPERKMHLEGSNIEVFSNETKFLSSTKAPPSPFKTVLEHADALVYVIDDSMDSPEAQLEELVQILDCLCSRSDSSGEHELRTPVWICLHKWDQAMKRLQASQMDAEMLFTHWSAAMGRMLSLPWVFSRDGASRMLFREPPEKSQRAPVAIQPTSIFDDSCLQSMTSLLRQMLPQLELLQQWLDTFVQESDVSEAFLFDAFTRLCLSEATGSAPRLRYRSLAAEWTVAARECYLALHPSEFSEETRITKSHGRHLSEDTETNTVDSFGSIQATIQLTQGDQLTMTHLSPVLVLVYVTRSSSAVEMIPSSLASEESSQRLQSALATLCQHVQHWEAALAESKNDDQGLYSDISKLGC